MRGLISNGNIFLLWVVQANNVFNYTFCLHFCIAEPSFNLSTDNKDRSVISAISFFVKKAS